MSEAGHERTRPRYLGSWAAAIAAESWGDARTDFVKCDPLRRSGDSLKAIRSEVGAAASEATSALNRLTGECHGAIVRRRRTPTDRHSRRVPDEHVDSWSKRDVSSGESVPFYECCVWKAVLLFVRSALREITAFPQSSSPFSAERSQIGCLANTQ